MSMRNGSYLRVMSQCSVLVLSLSLAISQLWTHAQVTRITTVDRPQWPMVSWPNSTKGEPVEIITESSVDLRLRGSGLNTNTKLAFTWVPGSRGSLCNISDLLTPTYELSGAERLTTSFADLKIKLKGSNLGRGDVETAYVCILDSPAEDKGENSKRWVHQGDKVRIRITSNSFYNSRKISIHGVRGEGNERIYLTQDGTTVIPADQSIILRLIGHSFVPGMLLALTTTRRLRGNDCDDLPKLAVYTIKGSNVLSPEVAVIEVSLPELEDVDEFYFICTKEQSSSRLSALSSAHRHWLHQGDDNWVRIHAEGRPIPVWLQIWLIVFLQVMSGLFSGLNLGLMALDNTELRIIAKCGTDQEKEYARIISPLRKRGNYLLCSIVLGNVLVNSILTVLLDDLTSGLVAILGSTVGIVIFGEIIPQAICSRHALAVGARSAWVTKLFMVLTFPMSYPISKILDCVLGEEIGNVYDRERLMEYIKVTKEYNKLEKEEVRIISGALALKKKTASDIMTKVEDVFMLPYTTILDFENINEIISQGFTRVPVFDGVRDNIVALLHVKDLALVDPDDNTPLKTLCEFYNHPLIFVFEDESLDSMLNEFKKGRSHMACIRRVANSNDVDPFYEITGVVTLEDVIEEIIQSEIIDETDVLTDNRRKQRRKMVHHDYSDFIRIGGGEGKNTISPQLALATFQYLSTSVEPFTRNYISETILRRLLGQNIFFAIRYKSDLGPNTNAQPLETAVVTIYKLGRQVDYFVMILEGRVKVTVGKEKLVYEAGPFTYFGVQAIAQTSSNIDVHNHLAAPKSNRNFNQVESFVPTSSFLPDYTVVPVSDVVYLKVTKAAYSAAVRATLMERQHRQDSSIEDCFNDLVTPTRSASFSYCESAASTMTGNVQLTKSIDKSLDLPDNSRDSECSNTDGS